MIRSLWWKEYREQRMIAPALALVYGLTLFGLYEWRQMEGISSSKQIDNAAFAISTCLALLCGLVIGAILLAGECEGSTQSFLDLLPITRSGLWLRKVLFGLGSLLVQLIVISVLDRVFGFIPGDMSDPILFALVICFGIYGFTWALFGSALTRHVLSAIGVALAGLIGFGLIVAVAMAVLWGFLQGTNARVDLIYLSTFLVSAPLPLLVSYLIYAMPDFRRGLSQRPLGSQAVRVEAARESRSWRVMLWLTWRQTRRVALIMVFFCFAAGFAAHLDGLLIWPLVSLLTGLVWGLTAFLPEQSSAQEYFLGTERVPPQRFWRYKIGINLFWAIFLAGFFWVVPFIRGVTTQVHYEAIRINLFEAEAERILGLHPALLEMFDGFTYLGFWLLNGFAVGQIFSMTCRKTVVAGFMSIGACLLLGALWTPSILFGGVHFWQVVAVPIVLVAASRLAYWPWVSGRLISRRPLVGLAACGLLAALVTAGLLAYRIWEVPQTSEPFDAGEFVKSWPTVEQNVAGRILPRAAGDLRPLVRVSLGPNEIPQGPPNRRGLRGRANLFAPGPSGGVPGAGLPTELDNSFRVRQVLELARYRPWNELPRKEEFSRWLDDVFSNSWKENADKVHSLREAPLGQFIDLTLAPAQMQQHIQEDSFQCADLELVLVARAGQLQAGGSFAPALEVLLDALAVCRHMRNSAPLSTHFLSQSAEDSVLLALERWQHEVAISRQISDRDRFQLFQTALGELTSHERQLPSLADSLKAEYMVVRSAINDPLYLTDHFARARPSPVLKSAGETRLLAVVPWEHERITRLLDAIFSGWFRGLALDYPTFVERMPLRNPRLAQARTPTRRSFLEERFRAWMPEEGETNAEKKRQELTELLDHSWLSQVLVVYNLPDMIKKQAELLFRVRALRIHLACLSHQYLEGKAGDWPGSFDALKSRFLETTPEDPIVGKPFSFPVEKALLKPIFNNPQGLTP